MAWKSRRRPWFERRTYWSGINSLWNKKLRFSRLICILLSGCFFLGGCLFLCAEFRCLLFIKSGIRSINTQTVMADQRVLDSLNKISSCSCIVGMNMYKWIKHYNIVCCCQRCCRYRLLFLIVLLEKRTVLMAIPRIFTANHMKGSRKKNNVNSIPNMVGGLFLFCFDLPIYWRST